MADTARVIAEITVDAPYRGEVGVILINLDPKAAYEIKKGEKVEII